MTDNKHDIAHSEVNTVTTIDMLRHGECEGGHIFRGATDVNLSAEGFAKMHAVVAGAHCQWDLIVSSPLKRCLKFSEALAGEREIEVLADNNLREMHFGDWEGREIADIWREHQQQMLAWGDNPEKNPIPNAEPLGEVYQRVLAARATIMSDYRGQKILMVTHGGVVRVMLAAVLAMPLGKISTLDVPYACLSRLQFTDMPTGVRSRLLGHNISCLDKV